MSAAGGMAINTNTPAASTSLTVAGNTSLQGNTDTTGNIAFGSVTRQMLNLFNTSYGIGIQAARMYFRAAGTGGFSWFEGGVHSNTTDDPGAGGTLRMRLTAAGQLQTTTGTISTLSDARLKSDVGNYSGALDQIAALRPVHYRYTDAGKAPFQPEGTHLGFIAQEVQQVFPEWVSQDESGYLMLSMRGFEAVAVRGMQELQAENAALRARLDAIEAKLAATAVTPIRPREPRVARLRRARCWCVRQSLSRRRRGGLRQVRPGVARNASGARTTTGDALAQSRQVESGARSS
ncbi:MAG: tail fiber domain-containing protein [Rhodanobacteraceae bacterium]|nr:tail fiber domain-containing protein [Rhodanobacteraceae bacterium]